MAILMYFQNLKVRSSKDNKAAGVSEEVRINIK